MKARSQQEGFTLLEVLVAMMILTIGILSLFAMQVGAIRGNSVANHLTGASTRALDQIEQILSWNADAVAANLADVNNPFPGAGEDGQDITADGSVAVDNYMIYWDGTAVFDPVVAATQVGTRVEVHVVWLEGTRQRQLTMNIVKPM